MQEDSSIATVIFAIETAFKRRRVGHFYAPKAIGRLPMLWASAFICTVDFSFQTVASAAVVRCWLGAFFLNNHDELRGQ